MSTRTATRTRAAATAAVLAGLTLTLAGCGSSTDDMYQSRANTAFLEIDGDAVTHIDPKHGEDIIQTIDDIENDEIDSDSDIYGVETGTLNDAGDTVLWDDGDDDPIEIAEDMIRWDDEVWVNYDSDEAKASREKTFDRNS